MPAGASHRWRRPPVTICAPLRQRVGDMLLDLVDGPRVDQRPDLGPSAAMPCRPSGCRRGGELADEALVDAMLYVDPVGQMQVWPALRNFATISAGDRGIEVGVVEHDEGRIAAEFQRQAS